MFLQLRYPRTVIPRKKTFRSRDIRTIMKTLRNVGIKGTKMRHEVKNLSTGSRNFGTQPKPQRKTGTKWNSVVGLEIHAQINSESKLFSGASAKFAMPINSCVSMFDCATPGTLPVLNRRCVEAGVLAALALSCHVNRVSLFDRKHYFYADLPAGYQITQQRQPLAVNGELRFNVFTPGVHKQPYAKSSKIKQIQLEQDSGKSLHDPHLKRSLVDLNRAGIPLIELVFEPDLTDGEEAAALVKELVMIFQRLDICSGKMEEGALRVDANISVNEPGEPLGVRTEVKNIGSVRGVAGAIKYEIARQKMIMEAGGTIVNETLSWDAENNKTVSMRNKEERQDYRFMPEPNLPPLHLHTDENADNVDGLVDVRYLRSTLPELPEQTRKKLHEQFGLSNQTIIIIVNEDTLLRLFVNVMKENPKRSDKLVANILIMELMTLINKNHEQLQFCTITERHIGDVVDLLESQRLNRKTAEKVLAELMARPERMVADIVNENEWFLINDDETLTEMCKAVIERNDKTVKQYKGGKTKVINALLGEVAGNSDQRANMAKVREIMERMLK